jgi:ABC-2 type transport system ATP-binding protein
MEYALEIKDLRKEWHGFTLNNVSFSVPKGYIMGLIGPNGAGKTTVIKLILNLIQKNGGEILAFGMDHITHEVEVKSRIGFVHDVPSFYDFLNLAEIASLASRFYKTWDKDAFSRLAKEFGLPLQKRFKTLSRGTKTKFALALALSHHADLVIMDEPTSGLDPVFRRELLEHLSALLQNESKTILFSTHITSDLERIADYITYIHKGEIVFSTTKDEILENWALIKGGNSLLNESTRALFRGLHVGEFGFEGLTSDVQKARKQFSGKTVIEKASLDDILFFTVKENLHV